MYRVICFRSGAVSQTVEYGTIEYANRTFNILRCGEQQPQDRVRLQRQIADGTWRTLKDKPALDQRLPKLPRPPDQKVGPMLELPIAAALLRNQPR